jgi:phospholipid N-methyltransferase
MSDHLRLLARFLRSPRTVGAIAPSSQVLAREMVRGLELNGAVRIVELGPGTGACTRQIVRRLGPKGWYLGVEIDPSFAERIRREWPSIECVCASAEQLPALLADRGVTRVDHVISGLPFASLPGATTRMILRALRESIRPGGTFTTFQYVHGYGLPLACAFRCEMDESMGTQATRRVVIRNLPPAYVLSWTRSG